MKPDCAHLLALLLVARAASYPVAAAADSSSVASTARVDRVAVRFHLVTDLPMSKKGVEMTNWLTVDGREQTGQRPDSGRSGDSAHDSDGPVSKNQATVI